NAGCDASQTLSLNMDDLQKMIPKFSPDIRGLLAWADGRLWVVTSTDDGDTMIADEWTPRGDYSKRFTVPARYSRLRVGADGKLYGVTHDKDEYVIVQRLDVAPIVPWGGGCPGWPRPQSAGSAAFTPGSWHATADEVAMTLKARLAGTMGFVLVAVVAVQFVLAERERRQLATRLESMSVELDRST